MVHPTHAHYHPFSLALWYVTVCIFTPPPPNQQRIIFYFSSLFPPAPFILPHAGKV
jgi:hypothetical protein